MKVLKGEIISKGIVKGTVCLYTSQEETNVPHYSIEKKDIPHEISRLDHAFIKTRKVIETNAHLAKRIIDVKAEEIFMVHLVILNDPALNEKIKEKISKFLINAEHAINDTFNEIIEDYKKKEAHFAELNQDFLEIKDRLLNSFKNSKGTFQCSIGETSRVIMATDYLTIDSLLNVQGNKILGIIVNECGFTSHSAILARSLDIPVISGINVREELNCNDKAIIDAHKGNLYIHPDSAVIEKYKTMIRAEKTRDLLDLKYQKIRTLDNKPIKLKLNINTINFLDNINIKETDGIGLFRTEFAFLNDEYIPDVEAQYSIYKKAAESAHGREVVIRLLDIDSDKIPRYLPVIKGMNLELGIRGARAVEVYTDFYDKQMEALFLTAKEYENIKVLYPMVSEFSDVLIYKRLFKKYEKKFKLKHKLLQGVLIEVPSAAIISGLIMENTDFVNIGSNDLLQYTLASDRTHPLVVKRYHILHPALLFLIDLIVKNGRKHKKEVCLCGEAGSIPDFYPLLINLGLESFSVSPGSYLNLKEKIQKSILSKIDMNEIMELKEYKDIEKFIRSMQND